MLLTNKKTDRVAFLAFLFALSIMVSVIAGCTAGNGSPLTGPTVVSAPVGAGSRGESNGSAHGGQQPVVGATVQLWAAGTSGYGSPATSLLSGTVLTDSNGDFTLYNNGLSVTSPSGNGNYTCPSASAQMYITVAGGNPGGGVNSALALMAVLGNCSGLTPGTFINVDEETTVAAVFSLQQFMTVNYGTRGSWSIGAPPGNTQGLVNAFATSNNLVNTVTGLAWGANASPASPPSYGGTITVEVSKIDEISNVLAACVNSTGGTACPDVFAAVTPVGIAPADTIQLALMMAQNPGYNVATVGAYSTPSAPFQPSSVPSDWTIGITYAPTSGGNSALNTPYSVAVDQYGNLWVSNSANPGSVVELNNAGSLIAGPFTSFTASGGFVNTVGATNGATSRTFITPKGVAIDLNNNAWVTNEGDNGTSTAGLTTNYQIGTAAEISGSSSASVASTGAITGYYVPKAPYAAAVDGNDNVWMTFFGGVPADDSKNVGEFAAGGSAYTVGGGIGGGPLGLAIDDETTATGGPLMWVVNNASCGPTDYISKLTTTGATPGQLTSSNYTLASASSTSCGQKDTFAAGTSGMLGIAIDQQNDVWIANSGVSGATVNGTTSSNTVTVLVPTLSGGAVSVGATASSSVTSSQSIGGLNTPQFIAIDGNDTGWVTNAAGGGVSQLGFSIVSGMPTITSVSPSAGYVHTFNSPTGIAIDGSGNVWVANNGAGANYLTEIVGAAGPVVTPLSLAIKNNELGLMPAVSPPSQSALPITTIEPTTPYSSFETGSYPTNISPSNGGTIAQSSLHATSGSSSLQVTMPGNTAFPGFRFNMSPNLNWSSYPGVAVDVYNPQTVPITLYSRVDDPTDTLTGSVTLSPQAESTVVFAFSAPYAPSVGMKSGPLLPGYAMMANLSYPIVATSVDDLLFYVPTTGGPAVTLYFDNVRNIDGYPGQTGQQSAISLLYNSMIDQYGQFTKASWPQKVFVDSDLNADMALPLPPSDRDQYGGSNTLTGYGATGYFYTTKLPDGNWWFVDPLGNLFFSLGVDSIGYSPAAASPNQTHAYSQTFVGVDNNITPQTAARFPWFTSLPAYTDPLASEYGNGSLEGLYCDATTNPVGCTFDFETANLVRKFGTSNIGTMTSLWQTETLNRLRAWGFNTIGDFSDPTLASATDSSGYHVPYTIKVGFNRGSYLSVTLPLNGNPKIADPYDPNFYPAMSKGISDSITSSTVTDPWLLGYFVDNEMPWAYAAFTTTASPTGSDDANYFPLIYGVIKSPSTQPAKVYWQQTVLANEYSSIAALNSSWGTSYASWTAFLNTTIVYPMTPSMRTDFSTFLNLYATKYYQTVGQAVHAVDSNHLYLGSKLAGFTPEVVMGCGAYCDVISFDIYAASIPTSTWSSLIGPAGKPAIAAEFQFGSTDDGAFSGGLQQVANQTARGAAYTTYVNSVYSNPLFIGAHWYQYQDQPLTGRTGDGENWGIGLTAITDRIYPELTVAATTTNSNVYKAANGGRASQ